MGDESIPENINGILIGGGYPEIHAQTLSQNKPMLNSIKKALSNGLPCIAECGGFMYLHTSMEDSSGTSHEMVGTIDAHSFKTSELRRFGYIKLTARQDNLLCGAGESINAHEFHYWDSTDNGTAFVAQKPARDTNWSCIKAENNLFAGYPHLYLYSNIQFAKNFLDRCFAYKNKNEESSCCFH